VSEKHADEVWECIEQARADGTIVQGGNRPAINGRRTFVDPTIVTDLPADHRLHSHEIFGPVALVTPFDTEEEAIAKANETPYGLAAALWTGSMARAHRVSARLVGRHRIGQHRRRPGLHHTFRRIQAVRFRPRPVRPRPGELLGL
jgi:gamma-glutamyl-gamma-aminobutyraldehyde dehydrogenase